MATYAWPVVQPPQASISPDLVGDHVGANVSLTVAASGTGPFSYQWSKDGASIVAATTATLTLSNAQIADSGVYSCAVSAPFSPTVVVAAPVFLAPDLGNTITLSRSAGAGSLTFVTNAGSAAYAGHLYVNYVTFDPAFGAHNFFGIHVPLTEILDQISLGPPFFGVLGAGGGATFSVGPGTLAALAGTTPYVQGAVFTPAGVMVGASFTAHITLQ